MAFIAAGIIATFTLGLAVLQAFAAGMASTGNARAAAPGGP